MNSYMNGLTIYLINTYQSIYLYFNQYMYLSFNYLSVYKYINLIKSIYININLSIL